MMDMKNLIISGMFLRGILLVMKLDSVERVNPLASGAQSGSGDTIPNITPYLCLLFLRGQRPATLSLPSFVN